MQSIFTVNKKAWHSKAKFITETKSCPCRMYKVKPMWKMLLFIKYILKEPLVLMVKTNALIRIKA